MDWDDLRFFLAVAHAESLSGAARTLGVTHSTVFRRIGALEKRLGVRLFERIAGGYSITAAGEEMLEVVERFDEDINALHRRLSGRDTRLSGALRITSTETLVSRLLMPHLAAFRRAHPGIVLEIVMSNDFFSLTKREADIAIRATREPPDALIGRRIAVVATAIYGAPSYLARHPDQDPAAHDWLALDDSLGHLQSARWLRRTVPAERVGYRANSFLGLLEAAKAGMGLAPLACFLGDADPGLRRFTPPIADFAVDLWLLTHTDLKQTGRVRAFMDFMAEALGREAALLEGRCPSTDEMAAPFRSAATGRRFPSVADLVLVGNDGVRRRSQA